MEQDGLDVEDGNIFILKRDAVFMFYLCFLDFISMQFFSAETRRAIFYDRLLFILLSFNFQLMLFLIANPLYTEKQVLFFI